MCLIILCMVKKLTGLGTPKKNMTVYKEGRRTNRTQSTISDDLNKPMVGGGFYSDMVFSNLFWTCYSETRFSDQGDSGGVVYTSDGKVLGIIRGYYERHISGTGYNGILLSVGILRADSIQNSRKIYVAHSNESISLNVSDNPSTGKVSLTWNGYSNINKYIIYRRSDSGSFVYAYELKNTNYDMPITKKGVVYEYLICGITKSGEKVWSNTAQCGFDVTSKPTWKSISYNSNTGIPTLKWNAATGANKYAIFYSTKKDGTYKQLDAVTKTEYTHSKAEGGKTYYYRICAFNTNSKAGVYPLYSDRKSHTCTYAKPTGVEISRMSNGRPKVTWNSVSGATKYYVYRSTKKSSGFTNVATVTSEKSYSDNGNLNIGTTYYYKVRVANSSSTPYSSVVSCMCKYAKPSWRKDIAFSTGGKPKLEWNSVSGVSNYDVYYSTDNKNFKLLKSVKGTSYTHGDAKPGCK